MSSVELPVLVRVEVLVTCGCMVVLTFTLPKFRLAGISLTVPAVRVIVAVAILVPSVTEVPVMVTVGLAGTIAGAAYTVGVPLAVLVGVTVPHADEQEVVPCVNVQVAPWLLVSLLTVTVIGVAFNGAVAFTGMIAVGAVTAQLGSVQIATETVMADTVMVIEPCWEVSDTDVATIVTGKSLAGGAVGAV